MTDDGARAHPVGLHRRRECDLHREDGRLNPVDLADLLRGRHRLGHGESGLALDQRLDLGDRGGESRLGGQKRGSHARPLRALPGEHPHRTAVVVADGGLVRGSPVGDLTQRLDQLLIAPGEHGRANGAVGTATRQRVGEVTELGTVDTVAVEVRGRPVGQPARGAAQLVGRGRGQREQQRAGQGGRRVVVLGDRAGGLRVRRLLEDRVHVGAGQTVGRHRGATGVVTVGRPRGHGLGDEQPGLDAAELPQAAA